MLLFTVILIVVADIAHGNRHQNLVGPFSQEPALDCAIRSLAYDYGKHLATLPEASASMQGAFVPLFDALRLAIDCNATPSATFEHPTRSKLSSTPINGKAFYADPVNGNDSGDGSLTSPFLTLAHAVSASRSVSPATIVLRNGTFYLPSTITLTADDNGLSIIAYPGEVPVISGGAPLQNLHWSPVPSQGQDGMAGPFQGSILDTQRGGCVDSPGASNPGVCGPLGKLGSAAACASACATSPSCTGYTWHDESTGGWATWCYARLDGYKSNDHASGHVCCWKTVAPNIWVATVPASVSNFDTLFLNGRRAVRARWPDGNPETQQSPEGWSSAQKWLPPRQYPPPSETHISSPARNDDPWFPKFQWGMNGTVGDFVSGSFWGTQHPPAGDQFRVPSGLVLPADAPSPANWTHTDRAIVHAFHGGLWGGWQFAVSGAQADGTVSFSKGGWQEARGAGSGAGFYLDNIKELISMPGEWYFDPDTRELTMFFNGTANSTNLNVSLVASQIETVLVLDGAAGVTLSGLTIAHTLTDYMLPYTVPSGGDWSYHDGGAVKLTNTLDCAIKNSLFFSVGGNAIIVSGSNRNTSIIGNEFVWSGSSAIVTAGTDGYKMQPENFPEGTRIIGNHAHESGVFIKQSGGLVYMGVSANATVQGNVFYNSPRAGVNVNDGFGGGHVFSDNLAFNHVRETSDHGR